MPRVALLLSVLAMVAMLFTAAPTQAQGAVSVSQSTAQSDFGTDVIFNLTAESSAGTITAVQLLYGAARSEALTVVDVDVTPGPQISVSHRLDTQVYYSPPGTDMVYRWMIRDDAGNEVITEPQDLFYQDQRFPWSEQSERNVTVYWYEGGDAFGDEVMQTALRTLDRLQNDIDATLERQVKIYIYANNGDMRSALQSNSVEWVGGQAWPSLGIIVAAIAPDNTSEVQRIVPHELSHQVLHQATENPYGGLPVWFDEGLAVYNQEVLDLDFEARVDQAAQRGTLVPLEALASGFPADTDLALQSYAQSRDVVAFIIDTYGEEKVQELVQAFAAATPVDTAVQTVLGESVDDLDAEWKATLPPAEDVQIPTPAPVVAPPDRFDNAPAQQPFVPAPPADVDQRDSAFGAWFAALPTWTSFSLTALCCTGVIAVVGAAVLVSLRLVGVDKRT